MDQDPTRSPVAAGPAPADLPALAAALADEAADLAGVDARVHWWLEDGRAGSRGNFPPRADLLESTPVELPTTLALVPAGWSSSSGATLELVLPPEGPVRRRVEAWAGRVAPFVAAALERERLDREVERLAKAESMQRALFEISDLASGSLEFQEMLRRLHAVVATLMYAENFFIALHDAERDTIRFVYFVDTADEVWQSPDLEEESLESIRHSLTWYLIREGRPLRGPTQALIDQVPGPLKVVGPHSADWLGVPMLEEGRVRGVMVVQHYDKWPCYSDEDQAVLSFMGSHILAALDRREAVETLEREVARRTQALTEEVRERERGERLQATLFRIAELSQTATGPDDFYPAVHEAVGQLIASENFYIALLSDDGTVHFPYFVDERGTAPPPRPLGHGITDHVLRTGMPLLADATTVEGRARIAALVESGAIGPDRSGSMTWLGVPLACDGRTVGVLAVQSYQPGVRYEPRDQELLTFIGYQIANGLTRQRAAAALKSAYASLELRVVERTQALREQIAERERIEERLKHEVLHDSLTHLPNRAYLREQLERALARSQRDPAHRFAILFMDLDRFKVINDSAGHLVGDALLVEVAKRFASCARGPDLVARLGGDEFAVLMDGISTDDAPVRLAQRLLDALAEPVPVEGRELFSSVSIGIVLSHARYTAVDELLRDADIAMYRAKAGGRHRFELFDETLHQQATDQLKLESDLRQAITLDEFEPFFQPILKLGDRTVVGYEALLRWHHPVRGCLAPGAFLPAAEAGGLLEAVDWRMYESVCRAVPALLRPGQYVNVNVSPRHLLIDEFDTRLLALLAKHDVKPAQLRIEVTEWALMDDPVRAGQVLDKLRRSGVVAALDDFGTGQSSLGSLHSLNLSVVKIDRMFVEALRCGGGSSASTAVADAILTLGRALGLEVVAEGIETDAQHQALAGLGCELGQGYLFGRPAPLAQIIRERGTGEG